MSQKQQHRWLVSYADMLTLLFAFFALLFALSLRKKEENFLKDVRQSFNGYFQDSPKKSEDQNPPSTHLKNQLTLNGMLTPQQVSRIESQLDDINANGGVNASWNQTSDGLELRLIGEGFYQKNSYEPSSELVQIAKMLGDTLNNFTGTVIVDSQAYLNENNPTLTPNQIASLRSSEFAQLLKKRFTNKRKIYLSSTVQKKFSQNHNLKIYITN